MGRTMIHRDRLLRDGTEVTVVRVFQKQVENALYKRPAALVRRKEDGVEREVWYNELVEPHRAPLIRLQRDTGLLNKAKLSPQEPQTGIAYAWQTDGLVVLPEQLAPGRGLRPSRIHKVVTSATVQEKLFDARGKIVERPATVVHLVDGRVLPWGDLLPCGGPGYARVWRRVQPELPAANGAVAPSVDPARDLVEAYTRAFPNAPMPASHWMAAGKEIPNARKTGAIPWHQTKARPRAARKIR